MIEISNLPILPNEMIYIIMSFLDHKTIAALQTSIGWINYIHEIKKIMESPFRLRCYRLGNVCRRCYSLHSSRNKYNICRRCWKKCGCGEIVNTKLLKVRCVSCKTIFCKDCIDEAITWKHIKHRNREYVTCRDCCDQYCFTCGDIYDFDTATKCNKCCSIYCSECDNGICYNCGIFYMEALIDQ